ncbi:MAG: hypothetical protein M3153_04590, partial [Chloroflexota bacterium]|nr:hypothetical protein [Chloroflexota bacterium]
MTYDRRSDPADPVDNETRVVERQTYVERDRPVAQPYAAPQSGHQVNVNADRGYGEPAYVDHGPGPL